MVHWAKGRVQLNVFTFWSRSEFEVKVTKKLFPRKLSWKHLPEIQSCNRNTGWFLNGQLKYTMFQGHEILNVNRRHDFKMVNSVDHRHVVAQWLLAPRFQI